MSNLQFLNGKNCYLAGAITADDKDGQVWRDALTPELQKLGIIVADPTKETANGLGEVSDDKAMFRKLIIERKFNECKEKFWPIVRKDLKCIDRADFIIMNAAPKTPTVGSIHELTVATHIEKKPVLLYCSESDLSSLNPWMLTFIKAKWLFTSWDLLMDYVKAIDSEGPDSSRWT